MTRPLALLLILAAGCLSTTPPSRFYVLAPQADAASHASDVSVVVGPVNLPDRLERPQIVTRIGPHERRLAELARWAEPLDENMATVIAENLSSHLGSRRVTTADLETYDFRVVVDVITFEAMLGGQSTLDAHWRLFGPDDEPISSSRVTVHAAVGSPDYVDVVSAMSRNVADLSAAVAAAVRNAGG